jgi:TrmH family RNA methyltransferase
VPTADVESPKNPRIKALVRLRERRERARTGRTLVEGAREVRRAVEAGLHVDAVYVSEPLLGEAGRAVLADLATPTPTTVAPDAFARLSLRQHPDGVAAVVEVPRRALADVALPPNALVVVAVGAEKPGNLGALVRSADAAGADAVLAVGGEGTDPWNPHVVRASMGSVFAVPTLPCDEGDAHAWLTACGLRRVATTPHARDVYWDADLRGPTALLLGAEHAGLPAAWLAAADAEVRVPMTGAADSLNLSVTGALLLFEAARQRRTP